MPYTPDPWYKSKRNFAAIILVISNLTYLLFGLEITPETQSTIVENLVII